MRSHLQFFPDLGKTAINLKLWELIKALPSLASLLESWRCYFTISMNKREAAEFLGIGVRSLERYMSQNRIAYTRVRGKTGEVVIFEDSELQRFKDELYQPTHDGAVEVRQVSPQNSSQMVTNSQIMADVGESLLNISEGIDALLEAVKELAVKIPVENKPLLTLAEARQLSGLSRQYLLQAIKEKRLKGQMVGRAWRVKRRDLECFVASLF